MAPMSRFLVFCLIVPAASTTTSARSRVALYANISQASETTEMESIIRKLGDDGQAVGEMKALAKRPVEAAGLLIRELHTVDAVRILPYQPEEERWETQST